MSEHRTIVLMNTATLDEVEVEAEVKDLPEHSTAQVDAEHLDAAAVNYAAELARDEYSQEHGADFIVVDIKRGD